MNLWLPTAILVLAGLPASAHRLDEYLQGTILSVDKNQLDAQMTLTPGVTVFPFIVADIDTDGDGVISQAEQRAYAGRVLRDLSIVSDGQRLTPRLLSIKFPAMDDMKEGRGEIRLEFSAALPYGGRNRRLTIENYHRNRISAYLVNCLVPRDPKIQISSQTRNYSQSRYQLDYVDAGVPSVPFQLWSRSALWMAPIGLFLCTRLVFLSRRNGG